MKKLMMIAAMMLMSVGAFAQNEAGSFTLKPMVGGTLSTLTKLSGKKAKLGLAAGFEGEYMATPTIGISAGLIYAMEGTKYEMTGYGADLTYKINNDYLNIPVLLNAHVAPGLAFKVGVQPAFKVRSEVSANLKYDGQSASDSEKLDDVKSFDFSIPIGLSYEINNIVLDARYNWGLTKVFNGLDCKNSVFMLTLGYRISFDY